MFQPSSLTYAEHYNSVLSRYAHNNRRLLITSYRLFDNMDIFDARHFQICKTQFKRIQIISPECGQHYNCMLINMNANVKLLSSLLKQISIGSFFEIRYQVNFRNNNTICMCSVRLSFLSAEPYDKKKKPTQHYISSSIYFFIFVFKCCVIISIGLPEVSYI